MLQFNSKQIHDSVHGTIGLSEVEIGVLSSRIFQRLHNIKQLGLAYLVYPTLNYSRFSHSLGACHIIGRMLTSIERNSTHVFSAKQRQLYRLAALLHDIGHYPFSHAMEKAVADFYKARNYLRPIDEGADDLLDPITTDMPPAYDHEGLGRKIITLDPELNSVFSRHDLSSDDVRSVFSFESPDWIPALISSDLDCDRLDYLLRTAHQAGLPYGTVDIEYIISQTSIDGNDQLALTNKALRATDHLLVSRYFDYLQVAFNKSVVALEWILEDLIRELLERGKIDCAARSILEQIADGSWYTFDDGYLMALFVGLRRELGEETIVTKLDCVINRKPPKLLASSEMIKNREHKAMHRTLCQQIRDKVSVWAAEFDIPEGQWKVWDVSLPLTKIGAKIPVGVVASAQGMDELEKEQAVRILESRKVGDRAESRFLMDYPNSLMNQMADAVYYGIRLYVCFGRNIAEPTELRERIARKVRSDLPHFPYNP